MSTINITLFKNKHASIGENRSPTWDEFASELKHKIGPKDGLAFTAGTFVGNIRKIESAQSRSIICLDIEQIKPSKTGELGPQPPTVNILATKLKSLDLTAIIYTTHSHRPDAPRYRVILLLDQETTIGKGDTRSDVLEVDREMCLIVAKHLGLDDCLDTSKLGIVSLFYAPRCDEENIQFAQTEYVEGRPLKLMTLIQLAAEPIVAKRAKRQEHAETVAKIAVAKRSSKNSNGSPLIDRLRPRLPTLAEALSSAGYIFYSNANRWLSPHSETGIAGVVVLNGSDGIERAYIHHANDPLCGANEVFGVKAHDALDIIIANRFGTSEGDFQRGLGVLAQEYGLDSTEGETFGNWAPNNDTSNNDNKGVAQDDKYNWAEPLPFIIKSKPTEYPLAALPEAIRSAIQEVFEFVKAPISMIASSALGAMSLAIQPQVDVQRAEVLSGPSSLYILVIADSGERKSSCDKYFTDGIRRYEKDAAFTAKPSLKKYDSDIEAWEMKVKGVKDQIHKLAKEGKATDTSEAQLKALIDDKPQKSKLPRFFYADTTPEELAFNLSQTWPTGGIVSSEAGLVFGGHAMGKDAAMRTLALYNVLWDGGSFQVDRRTSQSFILEDARLTIVLQVQESTLREFVRKTGDLARGTGFFARFLLSRPESTQGYRLYSEPPFHMHGVSAFNDRLYNILKNGDTIDKDGKLTPSMLKLTPEAKEAWIAFHDGIERQLVAGGQYQDIRDVASKIADNAVRLAALIHVFEGNDGAITVEAFLAAQAVVQWHLDESRRFFSEFTMPNELADAARLERWLVNVCRTNSTTFVRKNDLRQKGPVRDKKALEAAIGELVALNLIRTGIDGRAAAIFINPALLTAKAA